MIEILAVSAELPDSRRPPVPICAPRCPPPSSAGNEMKYPLSAPETCQQVRIYPELQSYNHPRNSKTSNRKAAVHSWNIHISTQRRRNRRIHSSPSPQQVLKAHVRHELYAEST